MVVAGLLMLIQGAAQVCRCILCLREGQWREPEPDVQETEEALLRARRESGA
ncbi:MAG: hypothetical protein KatS3mg118_3533 [Paracoccaceae bacterium]|nr:MAG: hypothetical protein KatS3mg118_3533 [Paracoccaceae bacterium]